MSRAVGPGCYNFLQPELHLRLIGERTAIERILGKESDPHANAAQINTEYSVREQITSDDHAPREQPAFLFQTNRQR